MSFAVSARAGHKFADLAEAHEDLEAVVEAYEAYGFTLPEPLKFEYGSSPIRRFCKAIEATIDRQSDSDQLLSVYLGGIEDWGHVGGPGGPQETELTEGARILVRELQRDGAPVDGHGRRSAHPFSDLDLTAFDEIGNTAAVERYVRAVGEHIDTNPARAIDNAKNLVEAVLIAILQSRGAATRREKNGKSVGPLTLLELAKSCTDELRADTELVPGDAKGSEIAKRLLDAQVRAVAELRNHFGDGHGSPQPRGARPAQARQAASAAESVCVTLLELWHRQHTRVECASCGHNLNGVPRMDGDRAVPCPECGSMVRHHHVDVVENLGGSS